MTQNRSMKRNGKYRPACGDFGHSPAMEALEPRVLMSHTITWASGPANGSTLSPGFNWCDGISADGRYVVFHSTGTGIVSGDQSTLSGFYVFDSQTGLTEAVSGSCDGQPVTGMPWGNTGSISPDGRYVAFSSTATNLVPGDTNGNSDVFLYDRQTGTTQRVSIASNGTQANGNSSNVSISGDGRYVAFVSGADNMVAGDTNDTYDIFVHDCQTGTTQRVSVATDGTEADGSSGEVSISADGRYVAFSSNADNLIAGDTNGKEDIFVHDCQTGATQRVSVATGGAEGNDNSGYECPPTISGDGRYVVFLSDASNLVTGDTNIATDAFVHDCQTGTTRRVSVATDGTQGDLSVTDATISEDGNVVAFTSWANTMVPNAWDYVYVHNMQTGTTQLIDTPPGPAHSTSIADADQASWGPVLSADGSCMAFISDVTNIVPGACDNTVKGEVFWYGPGPAVTLLPASDTGISNADNLTNLDNSAPDKTLQFEVSGTIDGATVSLYNGSTLIGSAIASGATVIITTNGSADLPDGAVSITARQTVSGQSESADSSALTITVDTQVAVPNSPRLDPGSDGGLFNWDGITSPGGHHLIDLSGFGSYYRLYRDGVQISTDYATDPLWTEGDLPAGYYGYTLCAMDAAGNVSSPSDRFYLGLAQETDFLAGQKCALTDGDGSAITLKLTGTGRGIFTTMNPSAATGAALGMIVLDRTSTKSALTITCAKGTVPGTSFLSLQVGNPAAPGAGILSALTAKGVSVAGDGYIGANAGIAKMTLADIGDGTSMRLGGNLKSFTAGAMGQGTLLDVIGSIATIKVSAIGQQSQIDASGRIKAVTVTTGNMNGSLQAQGPAGIGKITVSKGGMNGATVNAASASGAGIKALTVNGGITNGTIISNGPGGVGKVKVKGDADFDLTVLHGAVGALTVAGLATNLSQVSGVWNVQSIKTFKGSMAEFVNCQIIAGALGTMTISGNLSGMSSIDAGTVGAISINGDLRSDELHAIAITGDLGVKSKITIGGTAVYGAGLSKNRIVIGGKLLGQITVGAAKTMLAGMFGDVVVTGSANSTGKLIADVKNPLATLFAQSYSTITFGAGKAKNADCTLLFNAAVWPEA